MIAAVFKHSLPRRFARFISDHKTATAFGIACSLVFSIALVCGSWVWGVYQSGETPDTIPVAALASNTALCALASFLCFGCVISSWPQITRSLSAITLPRVIHRFIPIWTPGSVFALTAVTFFLWMPYIILLYPGILTYDSLWSLAQANGAGSLPMFLGSDGNAAFSSHKPIIHTWVLGLFLFLGKLIGSEALGLFALAVLQALFAAFAFALTCCYLGRIGVPSIMRVIALVFCCLFPFFPIYVMSFFNDTLFSIFYLLWSVLITEIVASNGSRLQSPLFLIALFCSGLMLACFKTPGVILIVITLVILAFLYRADMFRIVICAGVTAILVIGLMPAMIFPLANVEPTRSNEAFGPLFQMTAACVKYHDDDLSDYERNAIDGVLYYDKLAEAFSFETVDSVKALQRSDANPEDLLEYIETWARIGVRHPLTYLASALIVPAPFFCPTYPFSYYDDASPRDVAYYQEGLVRDHPSAEPAIANTDLISPPAFNNERHALRGAIDWLASLPIIGWLFSLGLWATWLPICCLCIIAIWNKRFFPALIPTVLSLLLLLISPWAMARYALPLIFSIPLLAGIAFSRK